MAPSTRYVFHRSDPGFYSEIYFPKKAAYQGAIFDALRSGFHADQVQTYLKARAADLLLELKQWPQLLDPDQYDRDSGVPPRPLGRRDAVRRIDMYESVFRGYSLYSVDGVYFNPESGEVMEESTQVVRLVFHFDRAVDLSDQTPPAQLDMFQCLCRWLVSRGIVADERSAWGMGEQEAFLAEYSHWPADHLEYARRHFNALARRVTRWLDDCALFIFGYLVRTFSERVLREKMSEKEILVVSFLDPYVNVVRRLSTAEEGGRGGRL
jgi:hypothetical protein